MLALSPEIEITPHHIMWTDIHIVGVGAEGSIKQTLTGSDIGVMQQVTEKMSDNRLEQLQKTQFNKMVERQKNLVNII